MFEGSGEVFLAYLGQLKGTKSRFIGVTHEAQGSPSGVDSSLPLSPHYQGHGVIVHAGTSLSSVGRLELEVRGRRWLRG